jgi:hypothetical protein
MRSLSSKHQILVVGVGLLQHVAGEVDAVVHEEDPHLLAFSSRVLASRRPFQVTSRHRRVRG